MLTVKIAWDLKVTRFEGGGIFKSRRRVIEEMANVGILHVVVDVVTRVVVVVQQPQVAQVPAPLKLVTPDQVLVALTVQRRLGCFKEIIYL